MRRRRPFMLLALAVATIMLQLVVEHREPANERVVTSSPRWLDQR